MLTELQMIAKIEKLEKEKYDLLMELIEVKLAYLGLREQMIKDK